MRNRHQSGFAMLLIFVMAASVAVMLYMEMPRLMFEAQRQKEQLLIERGEQYQRAIQVFVRTNKRYPQKMEDLEEFQDKRYLRRKFKDPLTGKDEWRLIHVDAAGAYTDSLIHKPPDPMGKDKKTDSQAAGAAAGQIGVAGAMLGPTGAPLEPGEVPAALQRRASDRPAVNAGDGQNMLPPCDPSQPYDATKPCDPNRVFGEQVSGNDPYNPSNPNPSPTVDPNQPGGAPGSQPGYPGQFPGQFPGQVPGQGAGPATPGQYPGMPGQYPGAPGMVPGMPGVPGQGVNPTMPGVPLGQPVAFPPGVPYPGQFPPGTSPQYPGQQYPGQQQNPQGFQPQFPGQQYPGQQPANPQGFQPQFPGQQFPGQRLPASPGVANSQMGGMSPTTPGGPPGNAAAQLINQILTTPRNNPVAATAGGQQGMGAGIAGVASQGAGEGIRIYNEKTKYKEWEFLYDPKLEKAPGGGNVTGFGQQGQQGQPGQQQGQQGRGSTGFGNSGLGGGGMGAGGQGSGGVGFGGQGMPRGRTQ